MASSPESRFPLPPKFSPRPFLATVSAITLLLIPVHGQTSSQSTQLHNAFALTFQVVTDSGDAGLRPFAQRMYQSIKEKAIDTLPKSVLYGEQGIVTVQLKIRKNGKLLFLPTVISSSGKKELDHHAISAIRGALPFDKLPASSPAPVELHINFYYNVMPPSPGP
jgi:TonB family protein